MHIPRNLPAAALGATLVPPFRGPAAVPARPAPAGGLWSAWLGTVMDRMHEREELRSLSPRERRDAGLTDPDVARLSRKPLWQA